MILKKVLVSLVLFVGLAIGIAGCASNEPQPQAMTGETQSHQATHWSQP